MIHQINFTLYEYHRPNFNILSQAKSVVNVCYKQSQVHYFSWIKNYVFTPEIKIRFVYPMRKKTLWYVLKSKAKLLRMELGCQG